MSDKSLETTNDLRPEERALLLNDLSKLNPQQRSDLYVKVCQSLGLNPLTQPFAFIKLNGKESFYATRNCTDQLRSVKNVSVNITAREKVDDLYIVTAKATLPNGRCDESVGAVPLTGLKGEALANAIMKCETKAKRRVTLCICGLSFMDETEVETIKDAKVVSADQMHSALPFTPEPISRPVPVGATVPVPPVLSVPMPTPDELDNYLGVDMSEVSRQIDNYIISVGNKHRGKSLRDVGIVDCESFVKWCRENNKNSKDYLDFMSMVELYAQEVQHEADKGYWEAEGRAGGTNGGGRENQDQSHY